MIIYACSSNPGKLKEFRIAGRQSSVAGFEIEPLPGLEAMAPPPEDGLSFEENALSKAVYYSRFSRELTLADDSGLEVTALSGAPGVHSARYAGTNATDAENNELLLQRLEKTRDRRARFVCVIAIARSGEILTSVRGIEEGEILKAPRGSSGFGYDPLFFYPPLNCTFAELTADDKFAVSHRGNALRALLEYLVQLAGAEASSASDMIG